MKRNIFSIAILALAMVLFSTQESKAQLPEGNIGIGASIGAGNGNAQLYYALSQDMDLALTLGYDSKTPAEGDANNAITVGLQYRYIFLEPSNTVDPYLSLALEYATDSELSDDYNSIFIGAAYGMQAELVKNVYLTAQIGVGINMYSYPDGVPGTTIESELSFGGSRLGAIIYMED